MPKTRPCGSDKPAGDSRPFSWGKPPPPAPASESTSESDSVADDFSSVIEDSEGLAIDESSPDVPPEDTDKVPPKELVPPGESTSVETVMDTEKSISSVEEGKHTSPSESSRSAVGEVPSADTGNVPIDSEGSIAPPRRSRERKQSFWHRSPTRWRSRSGNRNPPKRQK